MIVGAPQAPGAPRVNGPTLAGAFEEQAHILSECLSIADQIEAGLNGPKPVGTEALPSAPPSLIQTAMMHTGRLALLREKLIAIGQQL